MNLWRVRIDESSGRTLGEPEPLTAPASLAAHASLSADGRRLVYTAAQLTANIQRLAFDPMALAVRGDPKGVTAGSRRWSSPDPSPDGRVGRVLLARDGPRAISTSRARTAPACTS